MKWHIWSNIKVLKITFWVKHSLKSKILLGIQRWNISCRKEMQAPWCKLEMNIQFINWWHHKGADSLLTELPGKLIRGSYIPYLNERIMHVMFIKISHSYQKGKDNKKMCLFSHTDRIGIDWQG